MNYALHSIVEPSDSSSVAAATAAAAATALLQSTSDATVTNHNNTDIVAITEGILKAFTAVTAGLSLTYYVLSYTFSVGATAVSRVLNAIRPPGEWAMGHAYHLVLKKPLYYLSTTLNLFYPIIAFCIAASICGVIIGSFVGFVAEAVSSIVISATWGSDTAQQVIKEAVEGDDELEEKTKTNQGYLDYPYDEDQQVFNKSRHGMKPFTDYDTTEDEDDDFTMKRRILPFRSSSSSSSSNSSRHHLHVQQRGSYSRNNNPIEEEEDIYSHDKPPKARPSSSRSKSSEDENESMSTSSQLSASIKGFLKRRISGRNRSPSPPPFLASKRLQLSSTVPNMNASNIKHQPPTRPKSLHSWGYV